MKLIKKILKIIAFPFKWALIGIANFLAMLFTVIMMLFIGSIIAIINLFDRENNK